ncbi:Early growth response protein 1 [Colletotrichum viniferum]|nr:Early growth response protein 1 [Colletotrichum viniferum]
MHAQRVMNEDNTGGVSQHDPKRPYACPVEGCGKKFDQGNKLNKHEKKHSLPYKCQICPEGAGESPRFKTAFSDNKDLKRHIRAHHPNEAEGLGVPDESVECTVCGEVYTRQDNYRRHLEVGRCRPR